MLMAGHLAGKEIALKDGFTLQSGDNMLTF